MTTQLPAKLKTADINRFVLRANQLDKFKPAISYWCRYLALNTILTKGLQNADNESMTFATKLMDTIEQMKAQNSEDPAIVDESIAQPFIQHFALETFEKADRAIRSNTVTKQTADTFQASCTFLDLLEIWNPPSQDTIAKIKYAKYHALRIIKAIKAGEDPNASNPQPEPELASADVPLDPSDPEVQRINQAAAYQPSVEDASDDADGFPQPSTHFPPRPASAGSVPRPSSTQAPPRASSITSPVGQASGGPSPLESAGNSRKGSAGGGYFPEVTSPPNSQPSQQFSAPNAAPPSQPSAPTPVSPEDPAAYYNNAPSAPPPLSSPQDRQIPPPNQSCRQPPPQQPYLPSTQQPYAPPPQQQPQSFAPSQHPPPNQSYRAPPPPSGGYRTDDASVADAQKHARWAISALNFEDANTAVKELRIALGALGAGG